MQVSINNRVVQYADSRYIGKDISIGIDSSKRNTALAIGDGQCQVLDVIELNGTGDGTSEADTLALCRKQRAFLERQLAGAKVKMVGIENIVTVDKPSKERGMSQHMSRFKITAVFMSLIFFFQEQFGITPELINNQTWKSAVLPKEFTARSIGKGSLAYFKAAKSKYASYSDDATDAICILAYMQKHHGLESVFVIDAPEFANVKPVVQIISSGAAVQGEEAVRFKINSSLSLQENAEVMLNHLQDKKYGVAKAPISYFSVEEIFKYAAGRFQRKSEEVLLLVKRGEQ